MKYSRQLVFIRQAIASDNSFNNGRNHYIQTKASSEGDNAEIDSTLNDFNTRDNYH